jgi:glycosyltransferase involved in cell wall biosynthesis
MVPQISVVIPTFRRPNRAVAAARSALAQKTDFPFEVILVDNDPDGSAVQLLRRLAAQEAIDVVVLHEPRAGVAHARNAGVRAARGEAIAFLDDDEIAPDTWLAELVRMAQQTSADAVFGPVRTLLAVDPPEHVEFYESFFAREPHLNPGPTEHVFGCGCSLVRKDALEAEPFNAERNEIGGEDDLLFERMRAAGKTFAWAPGAWVWETPEQSRVTLRYTMKRAFAYGQGPAYKAWTATPSDWPRVFFWMGVGLVQTLVFAPLAALAFVLRLRRRAFLYRRAVEAVGKVLWFPLFKLRFYGASQLPRPAAA